MEVSDYMVTTFKYYLMVVQKLSGSFLMLYPVPDLTQKNLFHSYTPVFTLTIDGEAYTSYYVPPGFVADYQKQVGGGGAQPAR